MISLANLSYISKEIEDIHILRVEIKRSSFFLLFILMDSIFSEEKNQIIRLLFLNHFIFKNSIFPRTLFLHRICKSRVDKSPTILWKRWIHFSSDFDIIWKITENRFVLADNRNNKICSFFDICCVILKRCQFLVDEILVVGIIKADRSKEHVNSLENLYFIWEILRRVLHSSFIEFADSEEESMSFWAAFEGHLPEFR